VVYDIEDSEKVCDCGAELSRMGEDCSEQLDYVPAKFQVIKHIRPKYTCKSCEGVGAEGPTVKIAPVPKQILPKTIVSPRLLAQVLVSKFCDALPFYRQEQIFKRLGYELSRTNMATWTIQLSKKLERLLYLLHQEMKLAPLIHIDETSIQVLKEKGRSPHTKSYMWVIRNR
jgi:transposase